MLASLSSRLVATAGRPSGFDYLRLGLSTLVVLLHTVSISYGKMADAEFWYTPLRPLYQIAMPMFFALSGFLVAGSLARCNTLFKFLSLRAIRIYPALAVEVLLSACILGPLVTTHSDGAYFSNKEFFSYMLNVTGDIHFALPGVFDHNPLPGTVNGQLWTIPFELGCYITLTALSLLGILRDRRLGLFAIPVITAALILARLVKYDGHFPSLMAAFPGSLLVVSFISGVVMFLYRDVIAWRFRTFAICLAASCALLGLVPNGAFLSPVPIAYITIYLGLTNYRRLGFLRHADLSYGIFLYGYAIQQAVACLCPWAREWYLNFLIAFPLILIVAGFSWHFVEKPALKLKEQVSMIEGKYLNWWASRRSPLSPASGD